MRLDALKDLVAQDDEGAIVPILDPNGDTYTAADGTEVTMTILGAQSTARKEAEDKEAKKLLRKGATEPSPDDLRARRVNLAASCVAGWHGWEDEKNAPIPFSANNAKIVLETDQRILAQVEQAIERHSSFFAKPSRSSLST